MRILSISDDPRLRTGYSHICGAIYRHFRDKGHEVIAMAGSTGHRPFQPEQWEGITIWPCENYGNLEEVRYLLRKEKPDVVFLNADPRFFRLNVFQIDNEIRRQCPIAFYHIWDALPFPTFNIPLYRCCDTIITATQFTYALLQSGREAHELPPIVYAPIGINLDLYKQSAAADIENFRQEFLNAMQNKYNPDFIVGFVGRTIPRKRIYDMMRIFTKFAKGKNDVLLIAHMTLSDVGGNPIYVQRHLFTNQPIVTSAAQGQADEIIVKLHNLFDVSINIASAEGFGMPLVESMACGTPVIASKTAGPSGYVSNANGWLIEPTVEYINGNHEVPFCNDIYVSDESVLNALEEAYSNRRLLLSKAAKCRSTIEEVHNEKRMVTAIEQALLETVERFQRQPDSTLTTFPAAEVVNE